MARLAAAMPAACRAVPLNHAGTAPAVPAGVVLTEFVDATLDALVRGAQPKPGSPPADAGRSRRRRRDPDVAVDQRWLAALRAPDARVDGRPEELSQLAKRVRDWQHPITTAFASPFRLCFRIEEPAADTSDGDVARVVTSADAAWFVRYLLQAHPDPTLLIPPPPASPRTRPANAPLRAYGFEPRGFLLLTLGQPGRLDLAIV